MQQKKQRQTHRRPTTRGERETEFRDEKERDLIRWTAAAAAAAARQVPPVRDGREAPASAEWQERATRSDGGGTCRGKREAGSKDAKQMRRMK